MNNFSLIKTPIADELEEFKRQFDASLTSSTHLLNEVIAHIRQRNGKMMRPVLVLLMAKLYNEVTPSTYFAAVSLELLHTASLVHDDVVDESDLRRGQLSVNAIFNNKVAVLVGDFLLATCLVQAGKTNNSKIIDVISRLGQDLSEGELLQLSNVNNTEFSEEIYFDVIRKKTAALFAACTQVGALSVNASDEQVQFAHEFGELIGICFQIKDDIFDYFESEGIGKPTGNDMLEGKLTLPAIFALNFTHDQKAKNIAFKVKDNTASAEDIDELISFSKQNGGIEYAVSKINEYKQKALDMLDTLPDSVIKKSLATYLDYVVKRNV